MSGEEKILKKKMLKINKNDKKIAMRKEYIEKNRKLVWVHFAITLILFIWILSSVVINGDDLNVMWLCLFCANCIICVASIAMLKGYPLLLFWDYGKKINDALEKVEFLTGIGLICVKISCMAVILIGYIIYGIGLLIPGFYLLVSHKAEKRLIKKLEEKEKENQTLKKEIGFSN